MAAMVLLPLSEAELSVCSCAPDISRYTAVLFQLFSVEYLRQKALGLCRVASNLCSYTHEMHNSR